MKTLNIIGCGKVGRTLGRLLHASGACTVQDLKGQSHEETALAADFIQAGRPVQGWSDMRPADLWLITVPDTRIAIVAAEIAQSVAGTPRTSAPVSYTHLTLPTNREV